MEIAGFVLSILALFFSALIYIKHDKKIKQQSKLLNDYHLEKIIKEKEEEKKAIVEANIYSGNKGTRIIRIYNRGKSNAKNVNVTVPKNDGYHVFINPSPMDIRPQSGFEIKLSAFLENRPDKIEIEIEWDDDFKVNNKITQTIQI